MKKIFIIYIIIINLITFVIFGIDKLLAIKNKRRISEKTLLMFSFLGGCFLELVSMFIFKHKTRKVKFYLFNLLFVLSYIMCFLIIR